MWQIEFSFIKDPVINSMNKKKKRELDFRYKFKGFQYEIQF